jgi:hypothetical protein
VSIRATSLFLLTIVQLILILQSLSWYSEWLFPKCFPTKILYGVLSPLFSRTFSALQISRFDYLHINKISISFSVFRLLTCFVIIMSEHSVFHFFAYYSIFRVEELFSLESGGSTFVRSVRTYLPNYTISSPRRRNLNK